MVSENAELKTLGEMSEGEILARIFPVLPDSSYALVGPGDDCAVMSAPDSRFVITTDMMVQGPDFRLEWSSPWQVGFKAAATNLADVAAMGAVPTSLVVSLAAPKTTTIAWVTEFGRGIADACHQLAPGCGVVGGDLSVSPMIVLSITACGDLEGRSPLLRSAAEPGDVVAVSGKLGLSGLGLATLFAGHQATVHPELLNHQLQPAPVITRGKVAALAGAHAAMDISDSLVLDASRIAQASGVTIRLSESALDDLSAHIAVEYGIDAQIARQAILYGGEDHVLLVTFPATSQIPEGFIPVGAVEEGVPQVCLGKASLELSGWNPYSGWNGEMS